MVVNDTLIIRAKLILEEMYERLDDELSPNDDLAVRAAIDAAATAGFQVGTAEAFHEVKRAADEAGVEFNYDVNYSVLEGTGDAWLDAQVD